MFLLFVVLENPFHNAVILSWKSCMGLSHCAHRKSGTQLTIFHHSQQMTMASVSADLAVLISSLPSHGRV
jgi:hypothetical protein